MLLNLADKKFIPTNLWRTYMFHTVRTLHDSILHDAYCATNSRTPMKMQSTQSNSYLLRTMQTLYTFTSEHGLLILNFNSVSLQWRHYERDSVSIHRCLECLLNRLFTHRSKKASSLGVTGRCQGNSRSPMKFPLKGPVTRKMYSFDDVTELKSHFTGECVWCQSWSAN